MFLDQQPNTYNISSEEVKKAHDLGFSPDEYAIYDLKENDPKDYISEWERMCFRHAMKEHRVLLDNKIIFYFLIKNFARVNKIYAFRENGPLIMLDSSLEDNSVIDLLKEKNALVYKKTTFGGGKGFRLLEFKNEKLYINRSEVNENDILELVNDDHFILEEYCIQSDFENELWPYSVNTIRMITIRNDNGEVEITNAVHRIGLEKESCVDNACAGGLYSEIDIETGALSKAKSEAKGMAFDEKGTIIEYTHHPSNGHIIDGIIVPSWETLKKEIIKLHETISFTGVPFVAWDIALQNDGFTIIEGNTSCSYNLLQGYKGVRNDKVGIWMKEKGYIE